MVYIINNFFLHTETKLRDNLTFRKRPKCCTYIVFDEMCQTIKKNYHE